MTNSIFSNHNNKLFPYTTIYIAKNIYFYCLYLFFLFFFYLNWKLLPHSTIRAWRKKDHQINLHIFVNLIINNNKSTKSTKPNQPTYQTQFEASFNFKSTNNIGPIQLPEKKKKAQTKRCCLPEIKKYKNCTKDFFGSQNL